MAAEENKALVRRYLEEAWSKGNTRIINDILAPNYTLRILQHSSAHEDSVAHGPQVVKQTIDVYHHAFSDMQMTPQLIIAEGDRVAVEWTAHGEHTGNFRGIPPSGKQLSYAGITIFRVEDGKIVEEIYLADRLGLWQQLGIVTENRVLMPEIGGD